MNRDDNAFRAQTILHTKHRTINKMLAQETINPNTQTIATFETKNEKG